MRQKIISVSLLAVIIGALSWTFYINWPEKNEKQKETILTSTEFLKMNHEITEDEPIQPKENKITHPEEQEPLASQESEDGHAHEGEHSHDGEIIYDAHAGHDHGVNETEVLSLNSSAIDFQLKTLDGKTVRLSDLKGQKVLLNFWATWCPPCREEMPELQKYYEESAKKNNAVILGVNITDQEFGIKTVREFVDYYELTFPILLDETGDVSMDYEILSIPTTFIINEQGMIAQQINGPVTLEMLHQYLGD